MNNVELQRRLNQVRKEIAEEPEWLAKNSKFQGGPPSIYRDEEDEDKSASSTDPNLLNC